MFAVFVAVNCIVLWIWKRATINRDLEVKADFQQILIEIQKVKEACERRDNPFGVPASSIGVSRSQSEYTSLFASPFSGATKPRTLEQATRMMSLPPKEPADCDSIVTSRSRVGGMPWTEVEVFYSTSRRTTGDLKLQNSSTANEVQTVGCRTVRARSPSPTSTEWVNLNHQNS